MNTLKLIAFIFAASIILGVFAVLIIGLMLNGFHPTMATFF